ncbi:unnamed protein product [Absidia cylindrospora]
MNNNISNKKSDNVSNNNAPMELDNETTEVQRAIATLERMESLARLAQQTADDAIFTKDSPQQQMELVRLAMDQWQLAMTTKTTMSILFPGDLQQRCHQWERSTNARHNVHRNARDFVNSFEEVMALHQLAANDGYARYLPLTLGNQEQETWPMVKGWLLEFANTPKQRVKNTMMLLGGHASKG